jgi:hypothetical protein
VLEIRGELHTIHDTLASEGIAKLADFVLLSQLLQQNFKVNLDARTGRGTVKTHVDIIS